MSNVLIIKHGSLGDIAQVSGAIQDIKEKHYRDQVFILTTPPYVDLLSRCPHIDGVIIDKRNKRWNLFYLLKLRRQVQRFNFIKVYDLQNSSRTSFYRKFLFKIKDWSSSETTIPKEAKKSDFKDKPVLDRFEHQLKNSGIETKNCMIPDFSWSCVPIDNLIRQYFNKKILLLFPFCSPKLSHKKWPYYNDLIKIIKANHKDLDFAIAPDKTEIQEAKKINAKLVTNRNEPLNIMELSGLIKKSFFVISNDTGPAHMAAHLGMKGVALFGSHTTSKKVSIETENFKTISVKKLQDLSPETVYFSIKNYL